MGRPLVCRKIAKGVLNAINVVGIANAQDVPTVGEEPRGDILRKGDARVALDGDVIVVPDPAEVVEAEMTGQRGRFGSDAFHHAAVAAHSVDIVVENVEPRPVVVAGEPFLGDGHADAGGDSLAERAGGGFNARYPMVFRVARRLAVELAKAPDVVERYRRLAESSHTRRSLPGLR